MKKQTRNLLLECGIPQHIKGYQYLGTAIEAVLEDPSKLDAGITKVLYPHIAKVHNTTTSRVERVIRHAIETSFDRIDLDVSAKLFGWSIDGRRGKPTNMHFIAACVEVLKEINDEANRAD